MRVLMSVLILVLASSFASAQQFARIGPGKSYADVRLHSSRIDLAQTSETEWSLTKTGVVDTSASTITWDITAIEDAIPSDRLDVSGYVSVRNVGNRAATIGNIVVNLQARDPYVWTTQSSDIADATQDDAATSANVDSDASSEGQDRFTENAASGTLRFIDVATNTAFPLAPQRAIPPGGIVMLRFEASFDNTILQLPDDSRVRGEIIVTFGNARANSQLSATDLDANGNGIIDADERWVQSVSARRRNRVPASTPTNETVTLSDSVADITSTGTASFFDEIIDLGATDGTVTVTFDGGLSGGSITNCAHLSGSAGLDLMACDTQAVGGGSQGCIPGSVDCGWEQDEMIAYNQVWWGEPNLQGGQLMNAYHDYVYGSTSGVLVVGILGSAGYSLAFQSAAGIQASLPTVGAPGPLTADVVDPTTTASGSFGGDVVALKLNIDYSDAGYLVGTSGFLYGDLLLCDTALTSLDGSNLRTFLDVANTALGAGAAAYTVGELSPVLQQINAAFNEGSPSLFAQDHLFTGACP